jgi:hypothetical protein
MNGTYLRVLDRRMLHGVMVLCLLAFAIQFLPLGMRGDFSSGWTNSWDIPQVNRWNSPGGELESGQLGEAIQRAAYQFTPHTATGGFSAPNTAQAYRVWLKPDGVEIRGLEDETWGLGMKLAGWGYAGAVQPVGRAGLIELDQTSFSRVTYRYAGLSEWYSNQPAGLQQGFTIQAAPPLAGAATSTLVLEMAVQGTYSPEISADRRTVNFIDRQGKKRLELGQLRVIDAAGRDLPAEYALLAGAESYRLQMVIHAGRATYPIYVDPYLTTYVAKLIGSNGAAFNMLGYSAAVSGDTAILGAPGDVPSGVDTGEDKAYIFYRNQGGSNAWQQVKELTPGISIDNQFGFSVGIDGDIAVVGAPSYSDTTQNAGAVYVYYRNKDGPDEWGLVKIISPPELGNGDHFGWSVGLSGDRLVVGAPHSGVASNFGKIYFFGRNEGGADNWGLITSLQPDDIEIDDKFGIAVAIEGDTLAASTPYQLGNTGAVYVYRFNGVSFTEERKITALDGLAGDYFGWSLALDHDHLAVGSPFNHNSKGKVYLYERNQGGTNYWGEVKQITALDPQNGAFFGETLALSGETLLVGARGRMVEGRNGQGAVYILNQNHEGVDGWGMVGKITAEDGAANDYFGSAVALDGSNMIVGAYAADISGRTDQGAAYAYYRTGSNWQSIGWVEAGDAAANDQFACDVASTTEILVVGACQDDGEAGVDQGAAYVFHRSHTGIVNQWDQVQKLTPTGTVAGDLFGASVAIDGDKIVVGAPAGNTRPGKAYVFTRNQDGVNNWGFVQEVFASDAANGDLFGSDVAIDGDKIVVGAPGAGSNNGKVYVFYNRGVLPNPPWEEVKILPGAAGEKLGSAVAIHQDRILAGAPDGNLGTGVAYLYYRNNPLADDWVLKKTFQLTNGLTDDQFGAAVDLDGARAVVGAPGRNSGNGAFYIYGMNTGGADNWGQLRTAVGQTTTSFGASLDMQGDLLAVGAPGSNRVYTYKQNQGGADAWGAFQSIDGPQLGQRFGASVSLVHDLLVVGAPLTGSDDRGRAYLYLLSEEFPVDLQLELSMLDERTVPPGAPVSFALEFTNLGTEPATQVVISITHTILNFSGYTYTTSGVSGVTQLAPGVWSIPALDPGATGSITFNVRVNTVVSNGTYPVTGEILANEIELFNSNNYPTVNVVVNSSSPTSPTLVSPANNASITNRYVDLVWNPISSPDLLNYRVEYRFSGNDGLTWSVWNAVVINNTETTYRLRGLLVGKYEWRVYALYSGGVNAPSLSRFFNVTRMTLFLPNLLTSQP